MKPTPLTDAHAVFPSCNDSSDTNHPQGTHVDVEICRGIERNSREWKDIATALVEAAIDCSPQQVKNRAEAITRYNAMRWQDSVAGYGE